MKILLLSKRHVAFLLLIGTAPCLAQLHNFLDTNREGIFPVRISNDQKNENKFAALYNLAMQYILGNQPLKALNCYEAILNLANVTEAQKRIALFGIGKMQIWLERYSVAYKTYQTLLAMKLSSDDYQIALAGAIQALNYQDKPKQAVKLIPKKLIIINPALLIATVQAYLWSDNYRQAENILCQYKTILPEIEQNPTLEKQLITIYAAIKNYKIKPKSTVVIYPINNTIAANYITAAKIANAANNFNLAQKNYLTAYNYSANNLALQKEILFQLAFLQLNNGYYKSAIVNYNTLLQLPLNSQEYEVALNGYVRSLSAYNRSMQAFATIPKDFNYTMPAMLIAAAQAALWANWPDTSINLFKNNPNLVAAIPPKSYLQKQYQDVLWQDIYFTAPNTLGYQSYTENDSDNFSISRQQAYYWRRFSSTFMLGTFLNNNTYRQRDYSAVRGNQFSLQAMGYLGSHINYRMGATDGNYNSWEPLLYFGSFTLTPSDFMSFNVSNKKDIVESIPALNDKITMNSTNVLLAFFPIYRIYLAISGFNDEFNADNERRGYVLNPSILLSANLGLHLDGLYRYYTNSEPNQPDYFSPAKYSNDYLNLRLTRKLLGPWRYYIYGGFGSQTIESEPVQKTQDYGAGIRGPITSHLVLDVSAGYNNAAGTSDNGYARQWFNVNLNYAF